MKHVNPLDSMHPLVSTPANSTEMLSRLFSHTHG